MEYYKNKYLKYKNKYLDLKTKFIGGGLSEANKQLIQNEFPSSSTHNRIIAEINLLEKEGYSVDLSQITSKKLIVSDNNNKLLSFEIPDYYPFRPYKVFSVEQFHYNMKPMINYISNLPNPANSNILIYCHSRKYINSGDNKHWASETIDKTINETNLVDPKIYTIDIQKTENGPDLLANGFGDEFINYFSLIPTFDIVFMLDCAGPWVLYQGYYKDGTIDNEMMINLIKNVLRLVKQNGKLIISKIINEGLYEMILASIPNASPFITAQFGAETEAVLIIK